MAWEVECVGVGLMVGEFNNHPFLACVYVYILNKFNRNYNFTNYTVIMSRFRTCIFVFLFNIVTLRMVGMPAETCW